ncbi:M10 family metallopeptidase domain-containing protein [Pseudocnuella soli]|uniref:hypothetical protein n=1 Tax=Pseudocnuella soli TaxID=2502779 RepID=UPI00104A8A3A|nr:hypothetical protein [Pseudocnuella soli]
MRSTSFAAVAAVVFIISGCVKETAPDPHLGGIQPLKETALFQEAAKGQFKLELLHAEYITAGGSAQMGQTVFFKNTGNKQLSTDFVPGDPRRGGRTNITYAIDKETTADNGLSMMMVQDALARSMNTWDEVNCSNLNITRVPFSGNLGIYGQLLGFGNYDDNIVADVQHSGFLPGAFFDQIAPGGSAYILGVTFTFVFVTLPDGNTTDINGDGKIDVGMREIYYNDAFNWATNGTAGIDIETIALHEAGHGLSQAHFGKATLTEANGKLHLSPRAVMNAAYTGVQRQLAGTDLGGHCSNWGSWPQP